MGRNTISSVVKRAIDCGTSAHAETRRDQAGHRLRVDDLLGDPRQEAGIDAAFLDVARELGALRLQDDVILRR